MTPLLYIPMLLVCSALETPQCQSIPLALTDNPPTLELCVELTRRLGRTWETSHAARDYQAGYTLTGSCLVQAFERPIGPHAVLPALHTDEWYPRR